MKIVYNASRFKMRVIYLNNFSIVQIIVLINFILLKKVLNVLNLNSFYQIKLFYFKIHN